ncbi:MAG: carbamoyltransferase HypF, partial [Bacteroidota bacterium]
EPILSEGQEETVAQLADYILTHELTILQAQDDSLVRFCETSQRRIILRRARGIAPSIHPAMASPNGPDLLAMGADMKASFGLRSNGQYVLSQRLGELGHLPAQVQFKKALKHLNKLCAARPEAILADLHPGYFGRMMAQEMADDQNLPLYAIQHHEAHFAALLGEQNLIEDAGEVLGVVWDGLGYGRDGHIWGGEFFRLVNNSFSRVDHLSYFPQLGGENMALDPNYAAIAWAGDLAKVQRLLVNKVEKSKLNTLLQVRKNARIKTSSVGRLFDAVSALTGLCATQQYEGQAAIKLEAAARNAYNKYGQVEGYPLASLKQNLIDDIGQIPDELIALKFHQSLVNWMAEIAQKQGVKTIACSGGCFQNALLVDLIQQSLGGEFKLVFHEHLAPNDENIAYGQLIHYALTQEFVGVKNIKNTAVCA